MPNKPHTGKFIICFGCKKEFYIPIHRFESAKYCSRECKNKFGCTEWIKTNCKICKKEFEHISSRCNKAKYCSRLCYHRSQKGRGSVEYKCQTCKKQFLGSPSRRYRFCTPKCRGEFQRAPETYTNFCNLRDAMKRRGFLQQCQKCGYDQIKDILGIHHIDGNRKNNKRENLMVVCPNCHSLLHKKHIPH